MEFGSRMRRKIFVSPMPRVLAASSRCGSTCSKAPRAERYIMGKETKAEAITVEAKEKADVYKRQI